MEKGTVDLLIQIAENEVGTVEGPKDNETKYGKFTKANFLPWCGSFVMWCANQAGVKVPNTISTVDGSNAFKKNNAWFDAKGNDPLPGDIIYFDFPEDGVNRISHVGICIKNNGNGTIETIEGNTSGPKGDQRNGGMVLRKTRAYKNKNKAKLVNAVVGWGRPEYKVATKKAK